MWQETEGAELARTGLRKAGTAGFGVRVAPNCRFCGVCKPSFSVISVLSALVVALSSDSSSADALGAYFEESIVKTPMVRMMLMSSACQISRFGKCDFYFRIFLCRGNSRISDGKNTVFGLIGVSSTSGRSF